MRRNRIEGLWKHILLGYWIAAAFLFYFYAILMTIRMNGMIHEAFFHNPYIALGSLFPFLMLFQASILYFLEKRTIDISLLRIYLQFTVVQQVITGNLIGALLAFLYVRSLKLLPFQNLKKCGKKSTIYSKVLVLSSTIFIGTISLLAIFLLLRMS